VPPGKHLRVHTGDRVKQGDRLVFGPLVPQEILKISGPEAVQSYLVQEVQAVYRAQRVEIDDKHIEIIVAQMLRKVQVRSMGDTGLLPGSVIDKFAFRGVNDRLKECVKIKDPGDSKFEEGKIVSKEAYEEERARLEAEGKAVPTWEPPTEATSQVQLLGITKAAVQSESFISAASFQETTKVLTEAALAGKVDYLVGLKENVILGHLVPAGTGFHSHQEAEVRLNAPALAAATGFMDEPALSSVEECAKGALPPTSVAGLTTGELAMVEERSGEGVGPHEASRCRVEADSPRPATPHEARQMKHDLRLSRLRARQEEVHLRELELREKRRELERLQAELGQTQLETARREAELGERRLRADQAEQECVRREKEVARRQEEVRLRLLELERFEGELAARRREAERVRHQLPGPPGTREEDRAGEHALAQPLPKPAPPRPACRELLVGVPGVWHARPSDSPSASWAQRGTTPGVVRVSEGESYGLSVSKDTTDFHLGAIAHLADLPQMTSLSLNGCCRITDAGLAPVGRVRGLRTLSLSGCKYITGVGLAHLSGLNGLELLSLHGCSLLTDAGLGNLRFLRGLRSLKLGGCPSITDAGLAHLHGLGSLRTLELGGRSSADSSSAAPGAGSLTAAGLAALRAALPKCEIRRV
jgi:hypothetical protein